MRKTGQRTAMILLSIEITAILALSGAVHSSKFGTEYYLFNKCGADQVLKNDYRYKEMRAMTPVHCSLLCGRDTACESFDFDANHHTCYLGSLAVGSHCQRMETTSGNTKHYEEGLECEGGKELQPDKTCQCPTAFSGPSCSVRMQDCADWHAYLVTTRHDTVTWIWPQNAPAAFQVLCSRMKMMRMVVMRHEEGDISFYRGWSQYSTGFGNLQGDHWLGLHYMHLLTQNRNYTLRFTVKLNSLTSSDSVIYASYDNVLIGDAASRYTLTTAAMSISNSNVQLQDCLYPHLHTAAFSTYDNDNDASDDKNCAAMYEGGWWFNGTAGCAKCNPTGRVEPFLSYWRHHSMFWASQDGYTMPKSIAMFLLR